MWGLPCRGFDRAAELIIQMYLANKKPPCLRAAN